MSDIFINQEWLKPPTPIEIEGCHGHYVSINAGSKGHSYGDSCGCDSMNTETSIDFLAPILLLTVISLIYRKFKTSTCRNCLKL